MKNADNLWWLLPNQLAGMSMPFVQMKRRMDVGGALQAFDDDLPLLFNAGVRAVVCLLNMPSDQKVYESAGFEFLCLLIVDGSAPTFEQAEKFIEFSRNSIAPERAVAVHCHAGLGRTGTMLAAYLIAHECSAQGAINNVRAVESGAIETSVQVEFLNQFESRFRE
jgi:atypical dual specificity phosphatase